MKKYKTISILLMFSACMLKGWAQNSPITIVETPVDARASGMGGFSLMSTDRNYLYLNPGAIFQGDTKLTVSANGVLFSRTEDSKGRLMNGMINAGWRFHNKHAVYVGARYQGGLIFTANKGQFDNHANDALEVKPSEYTVDLGYTYHIAPKFSAFVTGSFIQIYTGRTAYAALFSVGGNFCTDLDLGKYASKLNIAFRVADFGSPIYYKRSESYTAPSKIELTGDLGVDLCESHQLTFALGGRYYFLPEEARYLNANVGAEYQWRKQFFFRAGYQYSSENNDLWSVGLGVNYQKVKMDLAFLKGFHPSFGNRLMATISWNF